MRGTKIKMRGSNTPGPVLYVKGFLNGRCETAGIDQDSNTLNSAYTVGRCNLYRKYCSEMIKKLETDVSSICTEAATLITELESMTEKKSSTEVVTTVERPVKNPQGSIEEAQLARVVARKRAKASNVAAEKTKNKNMLEDRRREIVQRLVQIRDRISTKESNCLYDLQSTQYKLRERFCIYGHGVLLKPMLQCYIPKLDYEWAFERYNQTHDEIKKRIDEVLNKEEAANV